MENNIPDFKTLSAGAQAAVLRSQRDEETGALVYAFIAKREKNAENAALLHKMSADEKTHAAYWQSISQQEVKPDRWKIFRLKLLSLILGYTFVIKRVLRDETDAVDEYEGLKDEIPNAANVQADEMRHEHELVAMLDEERLQYVGAMVLGTQRRACGAYRHYRGPELRAAEHAHCRVKRNHYRHQRHAFHGREQLLGGACGRQ